MIKKFLYTSIFLLCFSLTAKTDKSSQTFLFTRPTHQNLGLSQVFWFGVPLNKDQKTGVRINASYQDSRKADRIKQYFLPIDKAAVKIHNTATDKNALPVWFGLPDGFSGNVNFAPEQKQIGGTIDVRRIIGPLFGIKFAKDWWVQLTVAAAKVENNLKLTQSNVQNAAANTLAVYDIVTAFKNPDWTYLKIDGERSRSGLSEVRLTLGSTFVSNGRAYASSYSAISLPGKGSTSNAYMFDSQVGFNKHVGIIWGINMQAPLTREEEKHLVTFNINLESNFLIRNYQHRTFDLKDKEWSRYLLMRHKDETGTATVPGVNVLTHKVRVSPHALVDFTTSLRATRGYFQGEVGYGLWAHGGESVKITDTHKWIEEYQIAGTAGARWASDATIISRGTDSATFTAIKESDLDLDSCSQLAAAIHRIHIYGNLQSKQSTRNMHAGLGAFVEMPRNETKALSTYGVWFNAGGSF
ncbi:MAG: hypothetical protein ACJAZS_000565 [Alteromonas naphthalenivorans]|jgi:hypothetical protein